MFSARLSLSEDGIEALWTGKSKPRLKCLKNAAKIGLCRCSAVEIRQDFRMTNDVPLTSRSLPIALLRARERVMGPIRKMLADAGVTEQQWRVLRVLNEEGPQEPTHIADRACLLLPSLTRILQKLEAKDLIVRRMHPCDRRRQIIDISEKGNQIIKDNIQVTIHLAEDLRTKMGPERHEALLDLLNELRDLET